jgi:conjugative relaxase-like TrwC/TraI family protein
MVATIKEITNSSNATKYFYFIEKEFELSKDWHASKAVDALGISELNNQNFTDILNGKLGDIQLGRKTADGIAHHPGNELILSAPKSVSIMAMVAGDKRMVEAHKLAVDATIDYVQKHLLYARVTENKQTSFIKADNGLIAKFDHFTARPVTDKEKAAVKIDPQLHTHCLIANATLCADGKWRSVVFDALYQNKMFLGEIYRRELAHNIKELGYTITKGDSSKNYFNFEIAGVPEAVIQEFSNRRQVILSKAAEIGAKSAEDLALIAKNSRHDKQAQGETELTAEWATRYNSVDKLEKLQSLVTYSNATKSTTVYSPAALEKAYNFAIAHNSEREAVWQREHIFKTIFAKAGVNYRIADIETLMEKNSKNGKVIVREDKCASYLTTPENIQQERYTISLMRKLQAKTKPIMPAAAVDIRLEETSLSQGARDAVKLIMSSHDQVVAIQGSAGSGKTTALQQVRALATECGYEILGLAPTRDAVTVFKNSTGAEAQTLQLFLIKRAGVLAGRVTKEGLAKLRADLHKKIVILDEASLASTIQKRDLLKLADILRFRLALQGDRRQQGAIEKGKSFDYLQDNGMDTVIMSDIKRQQNVELRESVYLAEQAVDKKPDIANQLIAKALAKIGDKNIIDVSVQKQEKTAITNQELVAALMEKWQKAHNQGKEILVVVPSNPLRRLINAEIRQYYISASSTLVEHTILTRRSLTKAEIREISSYREGDVLVFRAADKAAGTADKYLQVRKIILSTGELVLQRASNSSSSSSLVWRPESLTNKKSNIVEVYEKESIILQAGEKIRWTHNSKEHLFITNGAQAVIEKISSGSITVRTANYERHIISLAHKDMQHIDHDYANTTYRAQGKTADLVIGIVRARELYLQLSTLRAFYIIVSRARHNVQIITDDLAKLKELIGKKSGDKSLAILHTTETPMAKENISLAKQQRDTNITPWETSKNFISSKQDNDNSQAYLARNHSERYQDFLRNPDLIRSIAVELFGQYNKHSKHDQLRFGDNSKIIVDLKTGRWYDFSTAEGGSLYQAYKEKYNFNSLPSLRSVSKKQNFTLTAEQKSDEWKIKGITEALQNSVPITHKDAAWGQRYLQENRKIDWQNINLSDDIRFVAALKAYENKKNYPALISVARDSKGRAQGIQIIYLDPRAPQKNSALEVVKISRGHIQGNFVEVTTNKAANTIFIAEGLETALSIAQSQKDARVICSLGIANIKNIDFSKEENYSAKLVIICADNDGHDAKTNAFIERAALAIKAQGVQTVHIIRPQEIGKDFNDLLKIGGANLVNSYIKPVLAPHIDYQKHFAQLEKELTTKKEAMQATRPTAIADFSIYRDPQKAFSECRRLLEKHGLRYIIQQIKKQPTVLGKLKGIDLAFWQSAARKNAYAHTQNTINDITKQIICHKRHGILNTQYQQLKLQYDQEKQKFCRVQLGFLAAFDSKQQDFTQLCQKLAIPVQHSLAAIDAKSDFQAAKYVTEKLAEQLLYHCNRYGKEATARDKYHFFLRAYFETSRKAKLQSYLTHQLKAKSTGDLLLLQQKLERMLAIDSRLANSSELFFRAIKLNKVVNEFNLGQQKIKTLTAEYLKQGMSQIKANFVAHAVVQYAERYGANMPLKQIEAAKQVSTYVQNNYQALRKAGFSEQQAQIVFSEGYKMLAYYDKRLPQLSISKEEVGYIQQESKQQMVALNNNIKATYKTPSIAYGGMEIGD